jgi:uncharacterized protein YifE (UPF0438 family)
MKSKKVKIAETFQLLEGARKQPITKDEKHFLNRHGYSPGQTILPVYNPSPEDERLIKSIEKKLPDLTILVYESAT